MSIDNDQKLDKAITLLTLYIEEVERNRDYTEQHMKEHEFLRKIMEEYDLRIQFWQAVKNRVVSGAIWGLIVAVSSALLFTAKSYFTGHM